MQHQRGFSESLQWALLTPVVMFAFLGSLQIGLMMHGRNVAVHAAAAAAQEEAAYAAPTGTGAGIATRIAAAGGLTEVEVRTNRGPSEIRVEVRGRRPVLVDLGAAYVSEVAAAPLEQVR